jgi:hypothetical protein
MNLYDQLAGEVMNLIRDEWDKQGHDLTGTFKESMRYEVKEEANSTVIRFIDGTERGYGIYLNIGVKPEEIRYPYAPARIKGLTNYAELRMGLEGKEAVSVAYAIATKHAKEGLPLPSTRKYSSTGSRTQFVQDVEGQIRETAKRYIIEIINSKAAQRK